MSQLLKSSNMVCLIRSLKHKEKQYEELKDIGFTFDTLIIDQGVSIVDMLSCVCIDDKINKVLVFHFIIHGTQECVRILLATCQSSQSVNYNLQCCC